jgi:four helix bundle protein
MNIAEGSVEECHYYLILANDLKYGDTQELSAMLQEVRRLLGAYAGAILTSIL